MANISIQKEFDVNRNKFYEAFKNNIDIISKNNPSVKSSKILEYKKDKNLEYFKREWHRNIYIPEIISQFIPKEIIDTFLHYIDYGIWDNDTFIYKSKIKPLNNSNIYTSQYEFKFEETKKGTLVKMNLNFSISNENILIYETLLQQILPVFEEIMINQMKESINNTLNMIAEFIN